MILQSASSKGKVAQMAGTYEKVIECLLNWYDCLHLIHQAHICAIMEASSLEKDNGR